MSKSCEDCKYYGALKEPLRVHRREIYGICFRGLNNRYSGIYPVYSTRSDHCLGWEAREDE